MRQRVVDMRCQSAAQFVGKRRLQRVVGRRSLGVNVADIGQVRIDFMIGSQSARVRGGIWRRGVEVGKVTRPMAAKRAHIKRSDRVSSKLPLDAEIQLLHRAHSFVERASPEGNVAGRVVVVGCSRRGKPRGEGCVSRRTRLRAARTKGISKGLDLIGESIERAEVDNPKSSAKCRLPADFQGETETQPEGAIVGANAGGGGDAIPTCDHNPPGSDIEAGAATDNRFRDLLDWSTCYYPWLLFTPFLFRFERRFPLGEVGWTKSLAVLAWISLPASWLAYATTIILDSGVSLAFHRFPLTTDSFWPMPLRELILEQALYWPTIGGACVIRKLIMLREKERLAAQLAVEKSEIEASLRRSELEMLRMRLNPHFLFNSLQNISVLARTDPDAASQMLARLGDVLRAALKKGRPGADHPGG